ncbi:serine/threonine-protein kinase [Polyangium sp. 15x6]|uniref:serine/threonine-protein kinase n=1 Tax=Polyangium sp. 15x6 TaxID=3042687 RepID=UPI002499DBD9|nr:serine/threonine-protein kinase [Polyangium sp. 15x6]MDI3290590.1 serine/threonine-protein kinase [Polyangium sp. 15x6]
MSAPRYEPLVKIASGGMATVYVGVLRGPLGFQQLVAIKRPHEHLLEDPGFRDALVREAQIAARIHHANVVDVRDVELTGASIQLVMDYVEGASLGQLMAAAGRAGQRLAPGVVVRIALDACAGLAAAHALADDEGRPLGLVHRDVSPQNILVGLDGVSKITDFGVAKAEDDSRAPTTVGTLKGKVGYMAPEYIRGERPDARVDVFAMGVVLWEALVGRRLFKGQNEGQALDRALKEEAPLISVVLPELGDALDAVVRRALEKEPAARFQSADEFVAALEEAARRAGYFASAAVVSRVVRETVGDTLAERRKEVRARLSELGLPSVRAPSASMLEAPAPRSEVAIAEATTHQLAAREIAVMPASKPRRGVGLGIAAAMSMLAVGAGVFMFGRENNEGTGAASAAAAAPASATASAAASATATASAAASATAPASAAASASASAPASVPSPARPKPTATATATAKPKSRLPPNPYAK